MIEYHLYSNEATARRFGYRIETKTGWAQGTLGAPTNFVHACNVTREQVRLFGLSPLYAREYLLDAATTKQLGSGKMIFAVQYGTRDAMVKRLWGDDVKYFYQFIAPAGTRYWSQDGTLANSKEIAFPYVIEDSDIVRAW
ncbi:MAG: hypothetical protein EA400_09075 [Chromatiaceae bacterium]|nr:MAG: hypothetical protein EA400_09075 [Chromatiaceae bacterium]